LLSVPIAALFHISTYFLVFDDDTTAVAVADESCADAAVSPASQTRSVVNRINNQTQTKLTDL